MGHFQVPSESINQSFFSTLRHTRTTFFKENISLSPVTMELFRSIICISVLTFISFLAFKDVLVTSIHSLYTIQSIPETDSRISRTFSLLVNPTQPAYSWAGKQTTSKGGFLWVHYNDTHTRSWEVSMLHALHCLHIVRRIVDGKGSKVHEKGGGIPKHVIHCMDYIAQVRSCVC
jgi:hypothetical protein